MFCCNPFCTSPVANPAAVVQGKQYRFTVLTSRLIRMEWSEDGTFEDRATKVAVCRDFPVPAFSVKETDNKLEIVTEHLHLYYDKQRFTEGGLSVAVKGLIKHKCAKWHFRMPQTWVVGKSTNLGGTCETLDMVDGRCDVGTGLIDRHGFVAVYDTPATVLCEDGWYRPADREGAEDVYFFGYLEDHAGCLRDFYRLSGAVPMIPRYALGNWWSRYYKYTEQTYKDLMEKFAEKKIPLAVSVLDMDWHITEPDPRYGNGWTGYTWNKDFFPNPKRFLKWLHDSGLHTTMNLHPADGIRAFEDCYKNAAKAMGIDPKTEEPVQFDASDPKFMRTYLDKALHPLEDEGVDFWWIDWQQYDGFEKDGYSPLWMLNHYLYQDNARKGTYPMVLSRYGGLGSHRYPVGFSGDTIMSWESLDFQPEFTNVSANVGYGWWSHDIGGHKHGIWSDDLQVRWCQYGVFSPIYRPHSGKDLFFLKEPWSFPAETEQILTDFMRLRHALIPYLYTMNYRAHADGLPLCLPMYFVYPHEMTNNLNFPNQYFFGSELMVCPITKPLDPRSGTAFVDAWIPEGNWFDFFTGRRYHGQKTMRLYRTQAGYPVLAKAGAIVPLADDGCVNGAPLPKKLKVRVFAGGNGKFSLYEDDERIENTKNAVTPLTFKWGKTATFKVGAVKGDASILPQKRVWTLALTGCEKPKAATVNGKAADWSYDEETHTVTITPGAIKPEETLTVAVETTGKLAENDYKAECLARLARYQIEILTKQAIFAAITGAKTRAALLSALPSVCTDEAVLGELTEITASAE